MAGLQAVGQPLAPFVYGQQLQKIAVLEQQLANSPAELDVSREYARRASSYAAKLLDVDASLDAERRELREKIRSLQEQKVDENVLVTARRELTALPRDATAARELWTRSLNENLERAKPLAGMPTHTLPFAGDLMAAQPSGRPMTCRAETSWL